MKKILTFATTFPTLLPGDATPGFVYELSKRLQEKWLEIIILTPRTPWSKKYEEKNGMKIYRFPYFFKSSWEQLNNGAILPNLKKNKFLFFQVPFLLLMGFWNIIKIVKKEHIDLIHAHWIIPGGFLAVLYKKIFRKNIGIICTSHGSDINGMKGKIGTCIKKFTLKNVDKQTVVSEDLKEKCISLWIVKNKIEVISMGVDTELFHPRNYDENIREKYKITDNFFLFVGRLAEKKWISYLVDSMTEIVKNFPETKLLIVGHGPLEMELKDQTKNLKLEKNIIFTGSTPNHELPKYYATADIFIGPSENEWFGLVFIEAILSWCITIGTNTGWIKDIIHKETGFFIEEKNSADISRTILDIFKDKNFNKEKAREIIEKKFSWEIVAEKYFNLLQK